MKKSLIALGLVAIAAAPVAALADQICSGKGLQCKYNFENVKPGVDYAKVHVTPGNPAEVTIYGFSPNATLLTCDIGIPGYNSPISYSFSNINQNYKAGIGGGNDIWYYKQSFHASNKNAVFDISQHSGSLLADALKSSSIQYIEIGDCVANASVSK